MHSRIWNLLREHLSLSLKCGSVLFLFLISVLVVACGPNNTAQFPDTPPVTVTINLNQAAFTSPTPALPAYACGAWATESTPAYNPSSTVQVYAKFVQNVDGNPVGMSAARATATFLWPSDPPTTQNVLTTSDGLAVFSVLMQPSALNHVVLVDVTFASADGQHSCSDTDSNGQNTAAFFTAVAVSPTATPSATPTSATPGGPGGGGPPTVCPTNVPSFLNPCNTPGPVRTPRGG